MKLKSITALVLSILSLTIAASCLVLTTKDLIGEYEMGHRLTLEGSSSYRSPFGATLLINSDGTFRGGSECFPVHGNYIFANGVLTLKAGTEGPRQCFFSVPMTSEEQEKFKNPPPPTDKVLTVVEWSARVYLIEEHGWQSFINAINAGLLPHTERESSVYLGPFYRKLGDEAKRASGLPSIPAQWKARILKRPLEAEVI